jgi:alkanesulfonate monooxygenase SsuD/methylene tetrahydromethanopterin reductase-like flavin-dependent oxidoreductase (luciferase family)
MSEGTGVFRIGFAAEKGVHAMRTTRGFGLAGETRSSAILAAAPAAELAGYTSFWLSQPRQESTLEMLARVAEVTSDIGLGVGAIPFDGRSAAEIVGEVREQRLPTHRLRLGVGSGTGPGSLDRLRRGVEQLRELIEVEIAVAPLGPKMCALAGEVADTVLLNWLTPEHAARSREWVEEGASRSGREVPIVATYVRCALGDAVRTRIAAECARYGSFPHYAAHFARQGVEPSATTILALDASDLQERLSRYDAVLDLVVVRAITPTDTPSEILELVEAARPQVQDVVL